MDRHGPPVLVLIAPLLILASCATLSVPPRAALPEKAPATRSESPADLAVRWTPLESGVDIAAAEIAVPRLELWAVRVDLADPRVSIVVGPEAAGPGTVRSIRTTSFLRDAGCIAAVNATPFEPASAAEGEERRVAGIAVSDGVVISGIDARYAALVFGTGGTAAVANQADLPPQGSAAYGAIRHAVGGFFTVLRDAVPEGHPNRRFPRTAAGVSADGRTLYLLVIDGRRRSSVGATEVETGAILAALGAWDGLILDGGGSSVLAVRRADGRAGTLNVPIHGGIPGRERAVAVCLGIRIAPAGALP